MSGLKGYMSDTEKSERKQSDKEMYDKLELSESELNVIKSITLPKETTITALINLLLRDKLGNVIKEENKEELQLRGFINENDNVTDKGKEYMETNEVKERLRMLSNE